MSDWSFLLPNIRPKGQEIKVSAPGKVILHGEHSVVYGKLAVAASLGLRTKMSLVEIDAPNLFVLNFSNLNFVHSFNLQEIQQRLLDKPLPINCKPEELTGEYPDQIHHDALCDIAESFVNSTTSSYNLLSTQETALKCVFYLVTGIFGSVKAKLVPFSLSCSTDLNIGAGTGSSASFLVALVGVLVKYVRKLTGFPLLDNQVFNECGFSKRELNMVCKWAFCAEKIVHGTPSGIDNTVCTFGSMVEFRKGLAPELKSITIPLKALLINTKIARETKKLVASTAEFHRLYPDLSNNIFNAMEDVAFLALKYIDLLCTQTNDENTERKCYEELGRLSSINHNLLSSLGASHLKLDEAVYVLSQYGLHGKLTGAGGGGYATCLVPPYVDLDTVKKVCDTLVSRDFDVVYTDLGGEGVSVDK